MRADLWPRLEPLLARAERPTRYINREWGARHAPDADYRAVLLYPDVYDIGQANQALHILYDRVNALEGVAAERAYLPAPDLIELMRSEEMPLFSLESCAPVSSFDLFGITVPYELTWTNVLEALDLSGLPVRSRDRGSEHPLVVGGGPCVFNPEPFAPFFDALLIGEGEDAVVEIVGVHQHARAQGLSRAELLERLAAVPGVYVPSFYEPRRDDTGAFAGVAVRDGAPAVVLKRVVPELTAHRAPTCPVVPFLDVVHDRYALEVQRGCTRGCRFCQAGMVYRPVRERSADDIVRDAVAGLGRTGYDEVSLTSLSTADHSQVEDVVRRLTRRLAGSGVSVSLPSLRVDAFSVDLARLVAGAGRKSGLTFAPEAGTQRLRNVINKNVTEEDLLTVVDRAFEAGWRRVKLYFMIGLPTETDEDVVAIGALVERVLTRARANTPGPQRGSVRIAVSVSTFVPKAQTPFQWEPQLALDEVLRRQQLLREHTPHKGVELHWHDAEVSFIEGVMARGGRELADVIEAAWRAGATFDAWTERFDLGRWLLACESAGVDPTMIANGERSPDKPLPWDHISAGVPRGYLVRERERAFAAETTSDCSFGGCTGCDVCQTLGVTVITGGGRQ